MKDSNQMETKERENDGVDHDIKASYLKIFKDVQHLLSLKIFKDIKRYLKMLKISKDNKYLSFIIQN